MDDFLEKAGSGPNLRVMYREIFIDNGIEDLETILELDDKHLEQMSVPLGHKLKMLKHIKEVRI